jgi:PIN domain nuclease of toxin-antitoxin system
VSADPAQGQFNIHDAKTNLSRIIDRVEHGEDRDPFDRMLVAQARYERLTLASRDPYMRRYDVELLDV